MKPTAKTGEIAAFLIYTSFQLTMKVGLSIQLKDCHPTLKNDVFCLVVFAANVVMPCVHIRHLKLYVNRKFSSYFSSCGIKSEVSRSAKTTYE